MALPPLGNRATGILDFLSNTLGMNDEEEKRKQAAVVGAPIQPPSLSVGPAQFGEPANMEQLQVQQQMQAQNAGMPQIGQPKPPMDDQMQKTAQLRAADQLTRQAAAGGDKDPAFMDKVKGYFGDEGNMLRLAMAFNTMRMEPDQQLAAYAAKRLESLQASKVASGGARSIAQQLLKMGYPEYAKQALANPAMAAKIYEQVIQKDLAPGAKDTVSGVQYTADGQAYIVRTPATGGEPQVQYLGTSRTSDEEKARLESQSLRERGNWDLSIKKSEQAMDKADNARQMVDQYEVALRSAQQAQAEGKDVGGIFNQYLPAMDKQTAAFRSAANSLGIGVINSATFGALSEAELKLAMSTPLNRNLSGQELIDHIKERQNATRKLYHAMLEEAQLMATMPYNEYIKDRAEREKENRKYMNMKAPEGAADVWGEMSPQERKAFIMAGN